MSKKCKIFMIWLAFAMAMAAGAAGLLFAASGAKGAQARDAVTAEWDAAENMAVSEDSAHVHRWEYSAAGAVLTATCDDPSHDESRDGARRITATLESPVEIAYTGEERALSVAVKGAEAFPCNLTILYLYKDTASSEYTELLGETFSEVGDYRATLTADGDTASPKATAVVEFRVVKGELKIKIECAEVEYGETPSEESVILSGADEKTLGAVKEKATFKFGGYTVGAGVSQSGKFEVTAEPIELDTHTVVFESCGLTILPRNLTVVLNFRERTYGDDPAGWVEAVPSHDMDLWYVGESGDISILRLSYVLEGLGSAPSRTTPAGKYSVSVTCGNENYTVAETWCDGEYTVVPRELKAEIDLPADLTYGNVGAFSATLDDIVNGDAVTARLHFSGTTNGKAVFPEGTEKPALAGKYTVRAAALKGAGADNYTLAADGAADFTIERAKLTVTARDRTIFYGDEASGGGAEYAGFVNGDGEDALGGELGYTFGGYEKFADAGDYNIVPQGLTSDNYEFEYRSGTLKVEPRQVGVTWKAGNYEYSGAELPLPEAFAEGLKGEKFTLVVSVFEHPAWGADNAFTVAGDYILAAAFDPADGAQAKNYTLDMGMAKKAVTVSRKPVTAAWGEKTYTYRGAEIPREEYPAATADDGRAVLDVAVKGGGQFRNVGKYTFSAALNEADGHNYDLTGNLEREYEIGKARLAVEWSGKDVQYTYPYANGGIATPRASAQGEGTDGTILFDVEMTSPDGGTFLNVGRYAFLATVAAGDREKAANYDITGETQEYKIIRAENGWEKTPAIRNWTYGESANVPTATPYFGKVKFTYSADREGGFTDNVPTAAGCYFVKATVAGNENYEGIEETLEFAINRAPIRAGLSVRVVYGDEIDGKDVVVTISDGLKYSDRQEDIEAAAKEKVGAAFKFNYTAGVTGVGATDAIVSADAVELANYKITFTDGKITVEKRQICVTLAGARTNTYGDAAHGEILADAARADRAGDWYATEADRAGLNGQLAYTFQRGAGDAREYSARMEAGEYTICVQWAGGSPLSKNYTILRAEGTMYTVQRRALTVTVTAEVVYGDEISAENVRLAVKEGFVSGDDMAEVLAAARKAASFDYGGYKAGATKAGSYNMTAAAKADLQNYTVTYESAAGNLSVAPRKIRVTLGGALSHIYGDAPARPDLHAVRLDGEGNELIGVNWYGNSADRAALENGASYILKWAGGSRALDAGAPAGNYTVELVWADDNYEVVAAGAPYRVERATLTVKLSARVTYGEEVGADNVTVTLADENELKNGDKKADIEGAAKAAASFDFGGYKAGMSVLRKNIVVTATGILENYFISYMGCMLSIERREITVKPDTVRTVYTGHGQAAEAAFDNLFFSDTLAPDDYTVTYSTDGAGEFEGSLPLAAGMYFAEVALSSSQAAANYVIVGERQFGYEILPAAIAEDFTRGFAKSRSALYSADDAVTQPLELPAQSESAFPLILQGNDNGIVNAVTLRYIVLLHAESGARHEELGSRIDGYLALLRAGAEELEGVKYADSVAPVREPKGYCVFFEAKAPNHETYYGYYTLHIYHERLTIKMADGLDFTSEYGDMPHTYSSLFDLVFEHIESITATAEDGSLPENKKAQFKAEKDYFQFYFTDAAGGREYAIGETLAANASYTLHVRYSKPGTAGEEDNYIEFVWDGGRAPTMYVAPRALVLTLGGSRTHRYGDRELGSLVPSVSCKNVPKNNAVNGEGLFGEDTVEGLRLQYTFSRGGQAGILPDERMDVGEYSVAVTCGNGNYTVAEVGSATYTVTPRPLTINLSAEVEYGDALGKGNVSAHIAGGLAAWDDAEAIISAVLDAGDYIFEGYAQGGTHAGERGATVRAESVTVGNYTVLYTKGDVIVTPRDIRVTLSGARTNFYGDERHGEIMAGAERVGGGTWYGDPADALGFTYLFRPEGGAAAQYSRTMEAGVYTIVIVWENGDYRIVGEPEGAKYTVMRAALNYAPPAGGSYDGTARELLETLEGVAGETLRRGEDYDVFYNGAKYDGFTQSILPRNAGTYRIRLELKGRAGRNYELGRETFAYTVAMAELEKPTGDRTVVYDGDEHVLEAVGFDAATMSAAGDGVDTKRASVTAKHAGVYTVRIAIKDRTNYCWAGGAQEEIELTLTVAAADIVENENFASFKNRDFLYHTSGEQHDLALPNQSSADFPFTVPGGDLVRVFYIVTEHEEGAHDDGAIEDYFKTLKRGEHAEEWHAANADMYVNTPKGYCVYIKIAGDNHNTYYGYYTVHIYHEEITIRLDESIVDGHFHNVEYGDAAHTQAVLRDRLYAHIREVVVGAAGDEGTMLGERLDKRYFTFYLIDENGVTHELGETDNGDRLPVGVYRIGVRYLKDGAESHYIRFRWYGGVQPDFEIIPRKIDLTVAFEGHIYGATPKQLAEQVTLSAVRSGGAEGAWYGRAGETFSDLGLTYFLRAGSGDVLPHERMAAGGYQVQIAWGNPNYAITLVPAEYTVYPRTLTADFGAFDGLIYGGANDPAPFLLGGVLWDDEVEISIVSYSGIANGGAAFAGSKFPTLAGDYTVIVELVGAGSGNYTLAAFEYAFTIGRAVYDMSGVTFADGVFKWDGSAHSLTVAGLPAGVWVSYTGNGRTQPGVYEVVAHFEGDFDNYMEIPARSAVLTILRTQMQSYLEGEQGDAPDIIVESAEGIDPTLELRMRQSARALQDVMAAGKAFGGGLAYAYDMDFYRNGVRAATSEPVRIRLLIPKELRWKSFGVFSVRGEGENVEITAIEYTVEGDYIVFTAEGLTTIAFTYANTPLGASFGFAAVALFLGLAAMAAEIKSIRKKRRLK